LLKISNQKKKENNLNNSPSNITIYFLKLDLRNFKEGRYEDVILKFDKSRAIKRGIYKNNKKNNNKKSF
jgi:hypothetical protein